MLFFIKRICIYCYAGIYPLLIITLALYLRTVVTSWYCEIFPAIEIPIIYFYSTYRKMQYWQLFVASMFIDQIYALSLGTTFITMLIAEEVLKASTTWFYLRNYYAIHLWLFCCYAFLVIVIRYVIVSLSAEESIYIVPIIFYFFTTILSYPLIHFILETSLYYLNNNA